MRLLTELSIAFTLAFVLATPALAVIVSDIADDIRTAAVADGNTAATATVDASRLDISAYGS